MATKAIVRVQDKKEWCADHLRRLVREINRARIMPIALGLIISSLLLIALSITVGRLVIPPDEAEMSNNTVMCIGIIILILLFLPCALILRRLVYVDRRDKKIEELRNAMTLAKLGYKEALEALKKSDPRLAKKICRYIK